MMNAANKLKKREREGAKSEERESKYQEILRASKESKEKMKEDKDIFTCYITLNENGSVREYIIRDEKSAIAYGGDNGYIELIEKKRVIPK